MEEKLREGTYESAFMTRYSTSATETFVSSAMLWNESTRSSDARRKTDSMSVIRQIFWRKKFLFSSRIG